MPTKITKKKFIQAIENNDDGLTNEELAGSLNISVSYFYDLRKKYKNEIRDISREMAIQVAGEQINNLKRNARKGDTSASRLLLEIAEIYIPRKEIKAENDINLILQSIEQKADELAKKHSKDTDNNSDV